jgi:hypothetical protein
MIRNTRASAGINPPRRAETVLFDREGTRFLAAVGNRAEREADALGRQPIEPLGPAPLAGGREQPRLVARRARFIPG